MKNLTEKRIKELINENSKFLGIKLTEIEISEDEESFRIDLSDDENNLYGGYIFKNNVISDKDLDNQIMKILE